MNKFYVFPCIKYDKEGYGGQAIQMACTTNIANVLLFPVDIDNAGMINGILNSTPEKLKEAGGAVKAYRTMMNSWTAGGRFLSGILMSVEYSEKDHEDVIATSLILSDEHGMVDSMIGVDFVVAMIIAALDRREVIVSSELMKKLAPKFSEDVEIDHGENVLTKEEGVVKVEKAKKSKKFPVDLAIQEIAKKIISGKIK